MHDGALERHTLFDLQVDEVHQQNGVAHDDAGQRNHANHAGRGVLRTQQRVARHNADDGQRNRRHDDQRYQIGAKLRYHQQVDQDQADRVGRAHVAEGLVSDLPFAVPLERVVARGIVGLADEVLDHGPAAGCLDLGDLAAHLEHAVERTVELACHIANHIVHWQQVFVIDRLFAHGVAHSHQFADAHQLAGGTTHTELQQGVQIAMALKRQLQHHRRRVAARVVHVGGRFACQTSAQRTHDGLLRYAQQGGFAPVHQQELARCIHDAAVVHIDDAGRLFKDGAHGLGHAQAPCGFRAIDFSNQGGKYRRSGRHFHHLHVGAHPAADLLQRRAHTGGNGVALIGAVVLVHQIDLDVAHFATSAQIVLAHQTVEIDRRGGAGIGLVVGHLGYA